MKTMLITGGTRGIGAHMVRHFVKEGWRVAFCYRSSVEKAQVLQAETGALAIRCDVRDEAQVKALGVPYEVTKEAIRISVPNTAAATALIVKHSELFCDYEIVKGKMDDVFLSVTGKRLEENTAPVAEGGGK